MAQYTNAAGQTFPLPERPLAPREDEWSPDDEVVDENALMKEFAKDRLEEFIEFIEDLDKTIFWDFAESVKWEWKLYKEANA